MFRWAVSEELIDETIYRALATVPGLKKGRRVDPVGFRLVASARAMPYECEATLCAGMASVQVPPITAPHVRPIHSAPGVRR